MILIHLRSPVLSSGHNINLEFKEGPNVLSVVDRLLPLSMWQPILDCSSTRSTLRIPIWRRLPVLSKQLAYHQKMYQLKAGSTRRLCSRGIETRKDSLLRRKFSKACALTRPTGVATSKRWPLAHNVLISGRIDLTQAAVFARLSDVPAVVSKHFPSPGRRYVRTGYRALTDGFSIVSR